MDLAGADGSTTFLEMGFDSLFLTQVTQALQNKFNLKITFRQLLGDQSPLDALSGYIDSKLPAEVPSKPAEAALSISSLASTGQRESNPAPAPSQGDQTVSESSVERLMREQLQAMNQLFAKQLEAIRGGSSSPVAPSPAPVKAAIPVPVSTSVVSSVQASTPSANASAPAETKEEFKPFGPYKPPQKGTSGDLTAKQSERLKAFIEFYSKRTAKSKRMTEESRRALADPRVVSGFRSLWKEMVYPITCVRASH